MNRERINEQLRAKTALSASTRNRNDIEQLRAEFDALVLTLSDYLTHTHTYNDDNGTTVTPKQTTAKV